MPRVREQRELLVVGALHVHARDVPLRAARTERPADVAFDRRRPTVERPIVRRLGLVLGLRSWPGSVRLPRPGVPVHERRVLLVVQTHELEPGHLPEHVVVRVEVARRHRASRADPRVHAVGASERVAHLGRVEVREQVRDLLEELVLRQVGDGHVVRVSTCVRVGVRRRGENGRGEIGGALDARAGARVRARARRQELVHEARETPHVLTPRLVVERAHLQRDVPVPMLLLEPTQVAPLVERGPTRAHRAESHRLVFVEELALELFARQRVAALQRVRGVDRGRESRGKRVWNHLEVVAA